MDRENEQLEEIFAYYGGLSDTKEQEALVSLLREIQEVCGCIPPDVRRRAAGVMQVKESVLTCLVRRYPSLKEAAYQHTIVACTGAQCGRRDAARLLAQIRRELKTDAQGLSADGKVLLKTQNCLKSCRTAPNLIVDGVLYPKMEAGEKLTNLLRAL